jgi:hypothetical protein
MDMLQFIRDGGIGTMVLVSAIVGTCVLGVVLLIQRNRVPGALEGSMSIVLGLAAFNVATNLRLGLDIIAAQGATSDAILAMLRMSAGVVLLASFGVALLTVLHALSALRRREAGTSRPPSVPLRVCMTTAWPVMAVTAAVVLAALVRVAGWADPSVMASIVSDRASEFATALAWTRTGLVGAVLTSVLGLLTLGLAFLSRARPDTAVAGRPSGTSSNATS